MSCRIQQSPVEYTEMIADGMFPSNFEDLTTCGRSLVRVNARITQMLAMVVAAGREHFGHNITTWIEWCKSELNIDNASYRCHLQQIGDMLHGLRKDDCCIQQYKKAIALSFDKLLAIARIDAAGRAAFISHYPNLNTMERDEVRAAVAAWLNEAAPEAATQPSLPGFDKALDTIIAIDEVKLFELAASKKFDTVTAFRMSYSGVQLCRASISHLADHIDELDPEMLEELYTNIDAIRNRLSSAVIDRRQKMLNN